MRKLLRQQILARDSYICQYCGVSGACIVEHIIPEALGGHTQPYNLVAACLSCNSTKSRAIWTPANLEAITQDNPGWRVLVLEFNQGRAQRQHKGRVAEPDIETVRANLKSAIRGIPTQPDPVIGLSSVLEPCQYEAEIKEYQNCWWYNVLARDRQGLYHSQDNAGPFDTREKAQAELTNMLTKVGFEVFEVAV